LAEVGPRVKKMKKTNKTRELSRVPRRRGATYCSPSCGCGCTWEAHQAAVARADRMAAQLSEATGARWRSRVWENLGWHYGVECGTARVYGGGSGGIHCLIADDVSSGGGSCLWTTNDCSSNHPVRVLHHEVDSVFRSLGSVLEAVASCARASGRIDELGVLLAGVISRCQKTRRRKP